MSTALILVVNGWIASGKSTVAKKLAGTAEKQGRRSAVIDLDELWLMLDHQMPRSGKLEHWLLARRAAAVLTDEFFEPTGGHSNEPFQPRARSGSWSGNHEWNHLWY